MTLKKITQSIESFVKDHTVNGTIAAAIGNNLIYGKGFGIADDKANVPCDLQTQYNIASVTKQFTAAALLKALYDGNPSLEALKRALHRPLSAYLTPEDALWEESMPAWANTATLHDLLTHKSGIVNYTDLETFDDFDPLPNIPNPSVLDLVRLFKNCPLDFQPGKKFSYCNSGYFLIGQVVERLSLKSFSDYLNDSFFKPLGMKHTFLPTRGTIAAFKKTGEYPNLARGYTNDLRHPYGPYTELKSYWPASIDQGDGGIISNALDLIKWNNALHKGLLFSKEVLDMMLFPHAEIPNARDGSVLSYGYGIAIKEQPLGKTFSHSGGIPGYRTDLGYMPSLDLTVISFANVSFDYSCNQENRDAIRKELAHIEDPDEKQRQYTQIFEVKYPEVVQIMKKHDLLRMNNLCMD